MKSENTIVNSMYKNDFFSQWLGIKIIEVREGECILKMRVKQEMLNGFGIAHGGICYSFADSALAFASNSFGKIAVSIETSISHFKPLTLNDEIVAKTKLISKSRKIATYNINVFKILPNESQEDLVASFKGTVYFTEKLHS